MLFLNSKKPAHTPGCLAVHMVIAALFLLMSVVAFIGVYTTHFLPDGLTFGNSSGSLAIIAFAFTLGLFFNQVKACVMKCDLCGTASAKK
jgi:hypothetical protein